MKNYRTTNVNDTELIYSLLKDKYPSNQIEIEFNDNTKEYTLIVTNKPFVQDPDVPVDVKIKVIYGDSVTENTPLLLKKNGKIYIETIKNIFDMHKIFEYPGFKLFNKDVRLEKQYSISDYQIWTDNGWSNIKKVIRHKTNKQIYRVITPYGLVDVTEDHSLCRSDLVKIKPNELQKGDALLHSFPLYFNFNNFDILNGSIETKQNYLNIFIKDLNDINYKISNLLDAQHIYYILKSLNYNVFFTKKEKDYYLVDSIHYINYENFCIDKIDKCYAFVYDIETDSGRFNCGVGQIVVYNTDSIFLSLKYNRDDYNSNRKDTFKLASLCGDKLTHEIFNRKPIEMEFEKVFQPFILLSKKRYIGRKYDNMKDPFEMTKLVTSGIALTRRDYCKMVKNCYKEVLDVIVEMKDNNINVIDRGINIFKRYIEDIINYNIPFEDLIVSALLAKSYKTRPVHLVLAEKLKERNEQVQIGDRLPYIYIEDTSGMNKMKSELGEDPMYAKRNNLKYNRLCYLEQLSKPLLSFFCIILKDFENKSDELINYVNKNISCIGGKKLKESDFKLFSNED